MLLASLLVAMAADSAAPAPACVAVAASVAPAVAEDLAAALTVHGGAVRWVADRPLAVWLQPRPRDAASRRYATNEWRNAIASAVTAWTGAIDGLRFTIAKDSASADVRVTWATTLAATANDPAAGALASFTAGRTTLVPAEDGRVLSAEVVLAAQATNGAPYIPTDIHAVALHELGHALGLGHHTASRSVMAPMITSDRIDARDRQVLRALYAMPVGARCK